MFETRNTLEGNIGGGGGIILSPESFERAWRSDAHTLLVGGGSFVAVMVAGLITSVRGPLRQLKQQQQRKKENKNQQRREAWLIGTLPVTRLRDMADWDTTCHKVKRHG